MRILVALHVDTGHLSSSFVAADGVHILTMAGLVVQEPEADSHDQMRSRSAQGTFRMVLEAREVKFLFKEPMGVPPVYTRQIP